MLCTHVQKDSRSKIFFEKKNLEKKSSNHFKQTRFLPNLFSTILVTEESFQTCDICSYLIYISH